MIGIQNLIKSMSSSIISTSCWGAVLTIGAYCLGQVIQKRVKQGWCNPLLFSTACIIIYLSIIDISYAEYKDSVNIVSYFLLPGTVCLAIPLYEQFELLWQNKLAILSGILAGVIASTGCIVLLAWLFKMDYQHAATLLPKSVTSAIGIEISRKLGGIPSLSAAIIIMTGLTGHTFASWIFKVFKIDDPLAKGISLGTTSHALGTAKAMEMGTIEGAMSSLAITVAGIMTAIFAPIVATFLPK